MCQILFMVWFVFFFDLIFSAVFLGLSHHYFYLQVKTKQEKKTNEKEFVDWNPFLSSFSAFLYETAAASEQYFNWNEPKSHFKITPYVSLFRCCHVNVVSRGRSEGEFTAVLHEPCGYISTSSPVCSFLGIPHRRTARRNSGAGERDWMNEMN